MFTEKSTVPEFALFLTVNGLRCSRLQPYGGPGYVCTLWHDRTGVIATGTGATAIEAINDCERVLRSNGAIK